MSGVADSQRLLVSGVAGLDQYCRGLHHCDAAKQQQDQALESQRLARSNISGLKVVFCQSSVLLSEGIVHKIYSDGGTAALHTITQTKKSVVITNIGLFATVSAAAKAPEAWLTLDRVAVASRVSCGQDIASFTSKANLIDCAQQWRLLSPAVLQIAPSTTLENLHHVKLDGPFMQTQSQRRHTI